MALRSHRPRPPLGDPKCPAHTRWRLREPTLHLLTGASRLHAHVKPRSCTQTRTLHQPERTQLHNTLHTAWLRACTLEAAGAAQQQQQQQRRRRQRRRRQQQQRRQHNNTNTRLTSTHHITTSQHTSTSRTACTHMRVDAAYQMRLAAAATVAAAAKAATMAAAATAAAAAATHLTSHNSTTHAAAWLDCFGLASLLCLVHVLTLLGGRASLPRAINWD